MTLDESGMLGYARSVLGKKKDIAWSAPSRWGNRTMPLDSSQPPRNRGLSRPARFAGQSGASILEAVIGSLLVMVIAVNASAFFARGRVSFDQEEKKRAATLLAQDALERAISLEFDEIGGRTEQRTIGVVPYAVVVTVQNNAPEPEMKTVRVEVTWPATPTVNRSVSVVTMVYDS